ncbi:DUF2306 domain-containing protein [Alteromonas oceanisediminis]|uniref:DUF2306 domain-containing protein n=1 Tax=Alteromonas oceanisediminis TaxID=2836180 RepID=UPI001BD91BEE|nr:DUF2306 domain-containing protein [Alteromonas oceanisediminis]MBT0586174.1 DUF2306 domain-containing protein [Alteromonas oceanisediminis]
MKQPMWFVMLLLAIGTASYAVLNVVWPTFRPPFVSNIFAETPVASYLHLGFGAIAMLLGPFQFSAALRKKYLTMHRQSGKLYVVSVFVSSISGFILAWQSYGGLVTHVGFAMMALAWFYATAMAYYFIRKGEIQAHRQWMIRSYAITLAGVTLRIYLGVSFAAGIPFSEFYPVLSWIAWVPNLLVVEWWILSCRQAATAK